MAQDSTIPVSQDPVVDSAVAAIQNANAQVQAAQSRVNATQPYSTGTMPQPQMPVPSLKGGLFQGASSANLANQQPQTRAGARNKAIGMLAAQGARAIGAYFKKKENEKQQALSMDIHRSLELQSGIDEASQVAQQAQAVLKDPNASPQQKQQAQAQLAQAQATSQKNNKLLESLLNGKNGKDIAKAYDITFGKESTSSSMEDKTASMHFNAMQDAMKQAKLDQQKMLNGGPPQLPPPQQPNVQPMSRLQQFQSQLPSRMMANPAYAAAQQQYNETAKQAAAVQKNAMDLIAKYHKDETTLTQQQMRDKSVADLEAARLKGIQYQSDQRLKGDLAKAAAQRASAWARIQAAQIGKAKDDNTSLIKASTDVYNEATKTLSDIDKNIKDLQKQKEDVAKADSLDAKALTSQIDSQITALNGERDQQTKLQYAANLGMNGNPQGAVLQNLILAPDYKPTVAPTQAAPKKGESILQRGARIYSGVKDLFNESDGNSNKEPE